MVLVRYRGRSHLPGKRIVGNAGVHGKNNRRPIFPFLVPDRGYTKTKQIKLCFFE